MVMRDGDVPQQVQDFWTSVRAQRSTQDMNATEQDQVEEQIDDIAIEPPTGNGDDYEVIPAGADPGRLVGFRIEDKPEWKVANDLKRHPEKTPDDKQWAWKFELEVDGVTRQLTDWTSRSWHEKANAG